MTTEISVYVTKMTDGRQPTVYGPDTGLNYVADLTRQYMNYPGVDLEWIGTAVITGGTADHPQIGRVIKNGTLSALFEEMVRNPEEF